jgi:hypothetical protein
MELQRFCCRYRYLCITPLSVNYSVLHIGSRLSGPDRICSRTYLERVEEACLKRSDRDPLPHFKAEMTNVHRIGATSDTIRCRDETSTQYPGNSPPVLTSWDLGTGDCHAKPTCPARDHFAAGERAGRRHGRGAGRPHRGRRQARHAGALRSPAVVASWSLLIRGHSVPAVRQKLHLSPCSKSRSRLYMRTGAITCAGYIIGFPIDSKRNHPVRH